MSNQGDVCVCICDIMVFIPTADRLGYAHRNPDDVVAQIEYPGKEPIEVSTTIHLHNMYIIHTCLHVHVQ